jgi:tetratricopeptide (TPR) repeat protein
MGFFVAASAFLVLLPGANLLFPIGTIMAERFLYVPAIAFAAGVVWLVWFRLGRAAPIVLGVAILALGARTFARNADWHDELTLATAAARVSPASFKSHKMRANALLESDPSHGNIDAVIEEAEQSLAILDGLPADRTNPDMYRRSGGYYFMKGDRSRVHNADGSYTATAESVTAYRKALDLLGRSVVDSDGEAEKAKLYLRLGERKKAMEAAVLARALNPQSADVYRLVAGLEVDAGRDEDALVALMEGVLVTRDVGLTQKLAELYRGGLDPQGCAITAEGALNLRCPAVRRELCKAVSEVVKLPRRADVGDVRDFGCEADIH